MNKPASVFAGGWTPEKAEKFKNIQLPDKTRCKGCHKLKAVGLYSKKQQLDLKQRIAGHQGDKARLPTAEIITCRNCTSGQTQELTCSICGVAQGLEAFGKSQRKDPDNARCIVCVHEQGQQKWAHMQWEGDQSEDDDSEEDVYSRTVTNPYEDGSYQDGHGVASISSGLKEVNLAAHNNAFGQSAANKGSTIVSESDLLKSYSDEEFAGGYSGKGKGKEKAQGWQTFASEKDGKQAKEFVGYDSKGGAHRQVRSPSAVASDDSIEIVTNAPRGRSRYSHAKNSQFAKPQRGPSPPMHKDNMINQLKANTGRTVKYSDGEESSDEDWGTVPA